MRLHTDTHTWSTVHDALNRAQSRGLVATHVNLTTCDEYGSRKKARAFEIKLGTYVKVKGDKRTFQNSGNRGANSEANGGEGLYGATYDEWGWFIAELFSVDPSAIFGTYDGVAGFDEATKSKYTSAATA